MKKKYIPCDMEIVELDLVDVITTSDEPFLGEDDEF